MTTPKILPACILALCFLGGGLLQFIGAISLTQTNYLILALISLYLGLRPFRIRLSRSEVVLAALTSLVALGPILNGSSLTGVFVYIYYLICPFLAVRFSAALAREWPILQEDRFFKWILAFLVLQAILAALQGIYAGEISRISAVQVSTWDVVSGTFYMKSDNALSLFCALASITVIWSSSSKATKALVVAVALLVIGLANSKMFQQASPFLLIWTVLESTFLKGRYRLVGLLLLAIAGAAVGALMYEEVVEVLSNLRSHIYDIYDFRYGDNMADRLAPIGEIIYSPISVLGKGALTYYNPITKEWYYNSGFSLIYSFYFDFGLIGVALVLVYFVALTIELAGTSIRSLTLLVVFLCFCMFSPTITDIAFLLTYSLACMMAGGWRVVSLRSPPLADGMAGMGNNTGSYSKHIPA